MKKYCYIFINVLLLLPSILLAQFNENKANPAKFRVYDHLLNPREHPDDTRRRVHPPDWNTFENRTRFMTLRWFTSTQDNRIVNYAQEIEKYTRTFDLGDILWLSYQNLFADNVNDLIDEIKKRNLYLFDAWGYVPGSGFGGVPTSLQLNPFLSIFSRQFKPPADVLKMLETKLGDHWLGMDNGEQDGRYVGGYASQLYPSSANKVEQYLNFQRHFERLGNDLGNRLSTLVSLNFGHYFLKEGVYTLIGAETAQALPNSQVYYAFIRGAGKQYGVPWFGNASVWNRWGYKSYHVEGFTYSDPSKYGPRKGTSLNLMKRLLYSHILYNSMCVGFEQQWIDGDHLSPIGIIQSTAKKWVDKNGQPGVMYTPVAVMLDFFSGWSFPRHAYTSNVYRVWGNLPYQAGDFLTDAVLDLLYPDYQNSSYYHDESGFISPTPYGDVVDCILSDAPGWLLGRYPVLIVAGELSGNAEIRDKLQKYAEEGGHLIITAGNIRKLPDGIAGIQVKGSAVNYQPEEKLQGDSELIVEDESFQLYPLITPSSAHIKIRCWNIPAVVEMPYGKGIITVFASPFGVCFNNTARVEITNEIDKPLIKPYPLLNHVRVILDKALKSQMLFEVNKDLSLITCRKESGKYLLGICNNSLQEKSLQILSHCGPIRSMNELELDQSDKNAAGYVPEGFENANIGKSGKWTIAGGDTRIFEVVVREENVEPIQHKVPAANPKGHVLTIRAIKSIKEEILSRPTFFQHFNKVVVDWKYLHYREKDILQQEAGWIIRQKLGVIIDLTSGINLYPDLRLVNNLEEDYLSSMSAIDDVMEKMEIIGSQDLILSLHRTIQNNFTQEQFWSSIDSTVHEICRKAKKFNITIHLKNKIPDIRRSVLKNVKDEVEFYSRIDEPNFRLAPCTAILIANKEDRNNAANLLKDKVGLWIISTPEFDVANVVWNVNGLIANYKHKDLLSDIISIAPDMPLILDGVYNNHDEEYLDARALEELEIKD